MKNELVINGIPYLPKLSWIVTALSFFELRIISNQPYDRKMKLNRALLAGPDKDILLSVPVKNESVGYLEIETDHEQDWQRKHWQSIRSVYGRSAYFIYYEEIFKQNILSNGHSLSEKNRLLLIEIFRILKFPPPIIKTINCSGEEIYHANERLTKIESSIESITYRNHFLRETERRDLSVIDLIFNEGPQAGDILAEMKKKTLLME